MLTFIWKLKDSGAHKKGSVRTQSPITGSSNLCAERFIRKNCPWQRKPKKHLRHWLQFWQLKTWIHDNLCNLTINYDNKQHSQFLRCLALTSLTKLNAEQLMFPKFPKSQLMFPKFPKFPKLKPTTIFENKFWLAG